MVNVAEKIRSMSPQSILGKAQSKATEAASRVKIDTGKLEASANKVTESLPKAGRIVEDNLSAIKSAKTPAILLERMSVWKDAYSAAKQVGKTEKAKVFDALYKTGLEELRTKAPEVYKNRQLLRLTYELPKAGGKALWNATLGRVLMGGR